MSKAMVFFVYSILPIFILLPYMKKNFRDLLLFFCRSMAWASALFLLIMLVINVDDIKRQVDGNYVIVTSNHDTSLQKAIPGTATTNVKSKPKSQNQKG